MLEQKVPLLDVIISFLNAMKNVTAENHDSPQDLTWRCCFEGRDIALHNLKYLLGQILRNWDVPFDHHYVSKEALDLWKEISDDSISNYWYTKPVKSVRDSKKEVGFYNGASKKPIGGKRSIIPAGKRFPYRQVFHDEHVVPIKIIMDRLMEIPDPDYENVLEVLDHIYICKMLKEENFPLERYNRSFDPNEVIEHDYKSIGIEVILLKEVK